MSPSVSNPAHTGAQVTVHETASTRAYETHVTATPEETLARISALADAWGAQWQPDGMGGRLVLPVRAGTRRGFVEGPVSVRTEPGGSHLLFAIENSGYRVQYAVFFLLLLGGLGGLITVAAPFAPRLIPLVPIGLVLGVATWFLIIRHLTTSGPEDFLAAVARGLAREEE